MHILANSKNGYAVLGEPGWYRAFKDLLCNNRRNTIALNAYNEYSRLYDPYKWARLLYKNLNTLFDTLNMITLIVQEAKNPLRYKLSKIYENGKDGWNTINTMNVYENYVEV